MNDTIILEFYEHRFQPYSLLRGRMPVQKVKVAEKDVSQMTVPQIEKLLEIEEMLGRTYEITRINT